MGAIPELNVYPVPTANAFSVTLPGVVFDLALMDLAGRTVLVRNAINGRTTIDMDGLPAGTYALRLLTRDGHLLHSQVAKY